MRACRIGAGDQETNTVRAAPVVLRVGLCARPDLRHDVGEGNGAGEGEARGEGLLLHVIGEDAGVGGETGEGEAVVRVEGDDLFLVRGEVFGIALREVVSVCAQD